MLEFIAEKTIHLVYYFKIFLLCIDCRWTGLACTAGKPRVPTNLSGEIGSPTLYNVSNYPPNTDCARKIVVHDWMVSNVLSPHVN